MINTDSIKRQIDEDYCFGLAFDHFKMIIDNNIELEAELGSGVTFKDLILKKKSISILLQHRAIPTPSIEICLDLLSQTFTIPIGTYRLILDNELTYMDEFLVID